MTNTKRAANPFQTFATEHRLEMTAVKVNTRPGAESWPAGTGHWRIVLATDLADLVTYYSKGPGHRKLPAGGGEPRHSAPSIAEILSCLQSDASSAWCSSFEEWCSDMGVDTDSREAERTYEACRDVAAGLEDLLGPGGIDAFMEIRGDE